ncbi:MAG: DRTGG domain-containing protein [Lachnospiraceae bacterium]|nr:DRTGG domain-containing protein [Lachnospiraceae bacterium]
MTINEIKVILDATVLYGEDLLNRDATFVFSSDMMSDVLAFARDQSVLITGLCNPQVVRTAEMLDIVCIIFVRGKRPNEQILQLAKEKKIAVLGTTHHMFTTCGILYNNGLLGGA